MDTLERRALIDRLLANEKSRLEQFGYGVTTVSNDTEASETNTETGETTTETTEKIFALSAMDEMMLSFITNKVINRIEMDINSDIPLALEQSVIDMCIGEFFQSKIGLGQLTIADIDVTTAIKTISEGDTNVSFVEGGSQLELFNALIAYLTQPVDLADFRKIRW